MQEFTALDEIDYEIAAVLQIAPRAQWQQIGRVLGVDGSTAARRWARLTEEGLVWQSCYPLAVDGIAPLTAIVEIDCAPGRIDEVSAELALDGNVIALDHTTGARDLLIRAVFTDQETLARYLTFRLGTLDGIVATRSQVATARFKDSSRWRLDRMGSKYAHALGLSARRAPGHGSVRSDDMPLVRALGDGPRQSVTALAERTGMSPTTVSRRLSRLDADNALAFSCEVARFASGWPLTVTFWGSVPLARINDVGARIAGMRETRSCSAATGTRNLVFTVWLRSMPDLQAFEERLASEISDLSIRDRAISLWPLKIGGHLLDPTGRHIRNIPIGRWQDRSATLAQHALVERLRTARTTETDSAALIVAAVDMSARRRDSTAYLRVTGTREGISAISGGATAEQAVPHSTAVAELREWRPRP
ncbi:Lrp/AsnC family transcriptional regulator [Nocardia sp. NPDC052278]|uniref:Lrp/AsnC family transcriptional regulator n=1 Tax=unclassified Nocardia TaxID=2637762 RepID=UPI0036A9BCB1